MHGSCIRVSAAFPVYHWLGVRRHDREDLYGKEYIRGGHFAALEQQEENIMTGERKHRVFKRKNN